MKRRSAVKNLLYYSLGTGILLSCNDPFSAVQTLELGNLSFDNKHLSVIDEISKIIMPIHHIESLASHTTLPFIMQNVNDLYSVEKRTLFEKGYRGIAAYFEQNFAKKWDEGNQQEKIQFTHQLNEMQAKSLGEIHASKDIMKFFVETLKQENTIYVANTEYIQRTVRMYEMAPDRYNGSYLITDLLKKHRILHEK